MEPHVSTESTDQTIVDQAQSELDARKNGRTRSVSILYRFDELNLIEPWQRYAIVRQARALANREPVVIAWYGTWLALFVALSLASPAWFHGWALMATVFLSMLPHLFYYRGRVHHHVRQLLRSNAETRPA